MKILFTLSIFLAFFTCCNTIKRPLHAPSAPFMPMLEKKGDAVVAANISIPFDINGVGILSNASMIDGKLAYAFNKNFALTAAINVGWEKLIYDTHIGFGFTNLDTLNFKRNKYEFGVGYFSKLKGLAPFSFNLYTGIVIGNNNFNSSSILTTNSFFNHNFIGWFLQPSLHVVDDKRVKLGFALKYSSMYNTSASTNFNSTFRKEYHFFAGKNNFQTLDLSGSFQYFPKDLPQFGLQVFGSVGGSFEEAETVRSRNYVFGGGLMYFPFAKKK